MVTVVFRVVKDGDRFSSSPLLGAQQKSQSVGKKGQSNVPRAKNAGI
jgi:hypothetical protein